MNFPRAILASDQYGRLAFGVEWQKAMSNDSSPGVENASASDAARLVAPTRYVECLVIMGMPGILKGLHVSGQGSQNCMEPTLIVVSGKTVVANLVDVIDEIIVRKLGHHRPPHTRIAFLF